MSEYMRIAYTTKGYTVIGCIKPDKFGATHQTAK